MRVSRLNSEHDWTFGKGKANYLTGSAAIQQNVKTRLLSFKNDWFLDITANIDWLNILGNKNNEKIIRSEISRVVLATVGVLSIDKFDLAVVNRVATINIKFTDVFNAQLEVELAPGA